MKMILVMMMGLLLNGCATTASRSNEIAEPPAPEYREAYEVYPGAAGNGVSKHLIRSHTTAIMVRPASSVFELCNRAVDHVWDTGRRLEVRLGRFPMLNQVPIPELSPNTKGMDLVEWEKRLDQLSGQPPSTARVEFLMDGEMFYTSLDNAIDEARQNIDGQT